MAEFASLRRYHLSRMWAAQQIGDCAIASLLRTKQLAEPGTALPATFPQKAKLEAAGYVADTDLVGADECELREQAGLTASQAAAVLAALAAL